MGIKKPDTPFIAEPPSRPPATWDLTPTPGSPFIFEQRPGYVLMVTIRDIRELEPHI